MATAYNFVESWYFVVVVLLLLPNALSWIIFTIAGGFVQGYTGDDYEPLYKYHHFWSTLVKFGWLGYKWDYGWRRAIRKIAVIINLISLFWVWGYVVTLIFCAIGFIARWCWWAIKGFFGGLGRLIQNGWNAL